jgi:nitroreductase
MDVLDVVKTRRSVRDYQEGPVTEEDLKKILEGMRHAPSPSNIQPWKCVVLSGKNLDRVAELIEADPFSGLPRLYKDKALDIFKKVKYSVVVIQKNPSIPCTRSIGAAIQNMLLIAHSLGLGSLWVEMAPVIRIMKQVLAENGIKEDGVITILPVGRPADVQVDVMDRTKKRVEEFTEFH